MIRLIQYYDSYAMRLRHQRRKRGVSAKPTSTAQPQSHSPPLTALNTRFFIPSSSGSGMYFLSSSHGPSSLCAPFATSLACLQANLNFNQVLLSQPVIGADGTRRHPLGPCQISILSMRMCAPKKFERASCHMSVWSSRGRWGKRWIVVGGVALGKWDEGCRTFSKRQLI